jgi:hypothetical protein
MSAIEDYNPIREVSTLVAEGAAIATVVYLITRAGATGLRHGFGEECR